MMNRKDFEWKYITNYLAYLESVYYSFLNKIKKFTCFLNCDFGHKLEFK